jgi:hypothetical protein
MNGNEELVVCNIAYRWLSTTENKTDTLGTADTVISEKSDDAPVVSDSASNEPISPQPSKTYSNQRFKDVTVKKNGEHEFSIQGRGQIFEANFSWIVEDGHEELKKGHDMTDAGAPEWGNFSFTVNVAKKRPNSTLHLVLFEVSAKDGSRQHELPVLLY